MEESHTISSHSLPRPAAPHSTVHPPGDPRRRQTEDDMETATLLTASLLLAALPAFGAHIDIPEQLPTISTVSEISELTDVNGLNTERPHIMYFADNSGDPIPGHLYGNETETPVHESDVFFKLFTRDGPRKGEDIIPGDEESLRSSSFNSSEATIIVTHGFRQSIESENMQSIKNMYLAYTHSNVIIADWSKIADDPNYYIVKLQTVEVGQFVGSFVAFLVIKGGVNLSHVHLCGHSLGAHVVGIAGKNVRVVLGRKVGRITGLDPAGPLFSARDVDHRLVKQDAEFVDVIHTCVGWLGLDVPMGHVDFYPNGGRMKQPGCYSDLETAGLCSHRRSVEYFAESIGSRNFLAKACASYTDFLANKCDETAERVPMGQHTPVSASGKYYLRTASSSPYALG